MLDLVIYTYKSQHLRSRERWIFCEFKATLVHRASFIPVRTTQWDLVSEKKKKKLFSIQETSWFFESDVVGVFMSSMKVSHLVSPVRTWESGSGHEDVLCNCILCPWVGFGVCFSLRLLYCKIILLPCKYMRI